MCQYIPDWPGPEVARPRITKVDSVLDAASRRLATHGIDGTTIDDVAFEAGVSRATVYRYVGTKSEIVAAVIGSETEQILAQLAGIVADATTPEGLISELVSTAVQAIDDSAVLARLSNEDLRETLPFITVESSALVERVVATFTPLIATNSAFELDENAVAIALEEATRLVLSHLTTPRHDGSRLSADGLGARAAAMIIPLLRFDE